MRSRKWQESERPLLSLIPLVQEFWLPAPQDFVTLPRIRRPRGSPWHFAQRAVRKSARLRFAQSAERIKELLQRRPQLRLGLLHRRPRVWKRTLRDSFVIYSAGFRD